MTEYVASTYGDEIAEVYDALFGEPDQAAIHTLVQLGGEGPVLELGIGTGRLALPLRERGLLVHGIDASRAMVEKLRGKLGGAAIPVTIGDFSRTVLEERFSLVFVVFNTFFGLQSQEDQVLCFRNVASMLRPDGAFLIEAFVPDVGRFDRGQRFAVSRIDRDQVWLEAARHQADTQVVDSQFVQLSAKGTRLFPIRIRYAWPAELDLMARVAGLRLRNRWSGWDGQPFSSASQAHVSVYEWA
jgi:SAM-dependent methyltransferase